MKECPACHEMLPLGDFGRARPWRKKPIEEAPITAFAEVCKKCVHGATNRRHYVANAEAYKTRVASWSEQNPERRKEIQRNHARKTRWGKFGVTLEMGLEMLARAGGICEGCRTELSDKTGLAIDHDHATNRVRGVLCFPCNKAAGMVGDSPERLRRLADYLEFHSAPAQSSTP